MSRIDPEIDDVASVFSFLGNDVRLAILESLYDRTIVAGPLTESETYTKVREDAGVSDSGRFSYHLDKLTGRFVSKTNDGYRLREPGREVVRLRRTGLFSEYPVVEPRPVDADCYRCGSPVRVGYDNGHLLTQCSTCVGLFDHELVPSGTLTALAYPPSGVDTVDVEAAFDRAHVRVDRYLSMMAEGFCPECGGDVTASFQPCTDHDADEESVCGDCLLSHPAFVRLSCEVCGQPRITHPLHAVSDREPVAGALHDRGVDAGWERFAEVMRWSTTVTDDEVVFGTPDGDRFAVAIGSGIEIRAAR
ncbi:DUF7351 domain-containing protein [Halorubrum sp. DTA98]|uniref:DUF7351 domain-containing protein n=1 Tax=Halorubrum sp. DTA98 TaxID=3402163 RepID=UPI003AAB8C55